MTTKTLPDLAPATAPIEATGRERHDVSLLVVDAGGAVDTRFRDLGDHLRPGDVIVVNTSATEPAALDGRLHGEAVGLHLAGPGPSGGWIVEIRRPDLSGPVLDARQGDAVDLGVGSRFTLVEPARANATGVRLWRAEWSGQIDPTSHVRRHGRPIRYSHAPEPWPLATYRTIFERPTPEFSSAEMPSAARPFTRTLARDLVRRGVRIATITLHTGVSSMERNEWPMPERFEVPKASVDLVQRARSDGNRVIAVGTTAARAIESAFDRDVLSQTRGWTDLVLSLDRQAEIIDGIITGWHPPEASHLQLLESVVGSASVHHAYETAGDLDYRSHEFGDSCLLIANRLG